jgi:hypothetical protein
VVVSTDHEDLVADETDRGQVATAKDAEQVSTRYVRTVVATVLEAA